MHMSRMVESASHIKNTRSLVKCAMLLAIQVVLNATVSIYVTQNIRISFGFLVVASTAAMFGPVPAMLNAAAADVIGVIIKPAGPYFPGFTLSAILGALIYGVAFYGRDIKVSTVLIAKLAVDVLVNLALNSLWLQMLYGTAFFAALPARAVKNLLQYPIDVALLFPVLLAVRRYAGARR